jgi:hypothetical protein
MEPLQRGMTLSELLIRTGTKEQGRASEGASKGLWSLARAALINQSLVDSRDQANADFGHTLGSSPARNATRTHRSQRQVTSARCDSTPESRPHQPPMTPPTSSFGAWAIWKGRTAPLARSPPGPASRWAGPWHTSHTPRRRRD